jgi:hypothetical protein
MALFADNLARLRVAAATGAVPPDVARWAAEALAPLQPAAERAEARNALLRRAGALVSGTRWARARRLAREVRALAAAPRLRERASDDGVRELVAQALEVGPGSPPASVRHLYRLLGEG